MQKVIIAGGRDFKNYSLLKAKCNLLLMNALSFDSVGRLKEELEIVSGTANGADKLGEKYAKESGASLKQFPADWDKHGKSAGYIRNKEMAKYSTHLIAFWDGKSKGTKHMIDLAKEEGLKVRIVNY